MIAKLQHLFALSEQGAKDFVKAVAWTVVCNLSLMLPVGVIMATIQYLLDTLSNGGDLAAKVWVYTGSAVLILVALFVLHDLQYGALYLSVYKESANRRVQLAETLRKLPLSFFGNRDLSDLTATMITDCSNLDQMFSHYVPPLFASMVSATVAAICMFVMDWRMALAVLWVVPVAIALTAGSKALQDKYGTRTILAKRAITDSIQECLETIRDIKACNLQEEYLEELDRTLEHAEKAAVRSELATGVFVCSAQAVLRIGLATTVLVGAGLILSHQLDFLYYAGFLFAAVRLYDPLGLALQNVAATFSAKLQIERMRAILEEPVQTGSRTCVPDGCNITFDRAGFTTLNLNQVESTGDYAFFGAKLENITVSATVKTLGTGVFMNCKSLAKATLAEGVTEMGSYMFFRNTALTALELPNTLTTIKEYALGDCGALV